MFQWTRSRVLTVVSASALVGSLAVVATANAMDGDTVNAQVLAISDFHRQLQPPPPDGGGEVFGPDGE